MDPYIAITVNGVMCVIYLLFSSVQIFGLFLGKMELPAGYTYASYARRGFFELVFVCVFNIFMVLFTMTYFKVSRLLKILLTVICGCTYIMINFKRIQNASIYFKLSFDLFASTGVVGINNDCNCYDWCFDFRLQSKIFAVSFSFDCVVCRMACVLGSASRLLDCFL